MLLERLNKKRKKNASVTPASPKALERLSKQVSGGAWAKTCFPNVVPH